MPSRTSVTAFLLLAAGSVGFGGRTYHQSSRPRSEVAILKNASDSHVSIDVIDGERKGVPSHGTYEFLPGLHVIRVRLSYTSANRRWESGPMDIAFEAQAAAELKLSVEETHTFLDPNREGESKGFVKIWIEDANTGKRLNVAP